MHIVDRKAVMTTSPPTEGKQFRSSVLSMFIWMFVLSLPVMFCLALANSSQAGRKEIRARVTLEQIVYFFAGTGGFLSIPLLIGAWMLSTFCPTGFSAEGICVHLFPRRRRFVRWQDITSARTLRCLNLRWVLVYAVNE